MAESGNLKVAVDSLQKARKYSDEKNYGRSFAHYLVVFQLLPPNARTEYENEFTNVLHLWGSILHQREKYEDIFKCYHLATTYFPNSAEILNNLGVHTLKLKIFKSAKTYFDNALNIDRNFLPAEQNLQTTKYALVERWHFPMLNDISRNKSYAQAIFMEISNGFTNILDVGTGTGILSLFASKSKQCKSIIACDYSEVMFDIANKVFQTNNVSNVKLLKQCSCKLSIPTDLKKKVTLLITEIIDSGIFGENILETLIHAWDNLLIPHPYGKVIPMGVTIFVTGIESLDLLKVFRLIPRENNLLKLNDMCMIQSLTPYDTENLRVANVNYVTETVKAFYVNFNDVRQLKLLNASETIPNVRLKCVKNGRIDAFAVWFNLHLNESVFITNDPSAEKQSCWDQAVSHLHHPLTVQQGDEISIRLSCIKGCLKIDCSESVKTDKLCYIVPRDTILFLNDILLMNSLEQTANILLNRLHNVKEMLVLDMTPFPILGLLLVQYGARLIFRVKDQNVELAIRHMCILNSIDVRRVQFISEQEFNDFTDSNLEFDVIFQNVISPCGLLCEEEIHQVPVMKLLTHESGIYLPSKVAVWAQLVQCDWLDQATKVDDKNVCGFKIAEFINEYKSTEQRDMNLQRTPHIPLSCPVNLGCVTDILQIVHISKRHATIVGSGIANAVFYWFELELLDGCSSLDTRRSDAFANNAAFMLENCVAVNTGDVVALTLKQHKGIIKIYISDELSD